MRRALLLAALATGPACAQSSVTVYGGIDLAVARYKGEGTGSRTQLAPGGNQNSRLGFRGREDLGGGMYASFDLEIGLSPDTGLGLASNTNNQPSGVVAPQGLTFNRRSLVGLGGAWGELRFGRDYVPSFWPLYLYDPFRTGAGFGGVTIQGSTVTNLRASNSIGYFTPGCGPAGCSGFFAQVMYAFGENPSGSPGARDGKVTGLRVGYSAERWEVSAGRTRTRNEAVDEFTQTTGGGSWDTKFARLMLLAGEHHTGWPVAALNGGTRAPFWQVGAQIYVGADLIPVAYTRVRRNDAEASSAAKIAIGYVHNLSKRTALYATYARIDNRRALALPVNVGPESGPAPLPGRDASGWDVGIRHAF